MNQQLWEKITAFDFDHPPSEYGFSIRLANENFWTRDFTALAIAEYKKFMYLAATSDFMVSPSEIIDTVWHQHLIFTQSYQTFCDIIGKQVQHLPSTHNKEEFEKFKQAKERTNKLYTATFAEQPAVIWAYNGMYESLNLQKAKLKLRTALIIGILGFIALTVPAYLLLQPVYITINNPFFMVAFTGLVIATFMGLEIFNRYKLKQITRLFDNNSFIYHLQPFELVYLKTQKLSAVINGSVNELVEAGIVKINLGGAMELLVSNSTTSTEQLQVTTVLNEMGRTYYPKLLSQLIMKPIFSNTSNCMNAFKKYFNKSKKFGNLFYLNFIVLSAVLMLGFTRLVTGLLRDKPVVFIAIAIIVLTAGIIFYLNRLTKLVCTTTIPDLYKQEILPTMQTDDNWQWRYFLLGSAALVTTFVPLADHAEKEQRSLLGASSSSGDGSSCGSSCSSSCGGGCGGCGGGGD